MRKDICFVFDQMAKLYNEHCESRPVKTSQEYKDQVVMLKKHHKEHPFWSLEVPLFPINFHSDALLQDTDSNSREDGATGKYTNVFAEPDSAITESTS